MPELPEVQTIVNDLNKKIIGQKIIGAWFDAPNFISIQSAREDGKPGRVIKKPKIAKFEKEIKGFTVRKAQRRGKNIFIYLSKGKLRKILLVHQKMTGHLLVGKWSIRKERYESGVYSKSGKKVSRFKFQVVSLLNGELQEKVNDYIHFILYLDDGRQLALSDLRKFAKIVLGETKNIENLQEIKKLGPEPLEGKFTFPKFFSIIGRQKKPIKQVLMDQNLIAGIGNIYADEILWMAKAHPLMAANTLNFLKAKEIYKSIKIILKKAIKLRGTSISDFRDTSGTSGGYSKKRFVYRREKLPCLRCKTLIKRIRIGGRSAHYCPFCQKA